MPGCKRPPNIEEGETRREDAVAESAAVETNIALRRGFERNGFDGKPDPFRCATW
jgi:hypothetical protein